MHVTQLELLRLLNAEIVPLLSSVLEGREHRISKEDRAAMQEAADQAIEDFLNDVERFSAKK